MKYIIIYSDGSCYWKVEKGGYGIYFEFKEDDKILATKEISGNENKGYSNTTIDRMELRGLIVALESIKKESRHLRILIVVDREACINSINKGWVFNWEREGFFERKNADLWRRFLKIYRKFPKDNITFKHTRGHGKGKLCYIKGNDIADRLSDYKQFKEHIVDGEGVV